jgi:hypothetical protein
LISRGSGTYTRAVTEETPLATKPAPKLVREVLIDPCTTDQHFIVEKVLIRVVKALTRKFKSGEIAPQGRVLYLNPRKRPAETVETATKKSAGPKTPASGGKKR